MYIQARTDIATVGLRTSPLFSLGQMNSYVVTQLACISDAATDLATGIRFAAAASL